MPFISNDLTFGFGLDENAPFWMWFTAAWIAYAAAVTGLLALARCAAACRAACLIVWPLLLLAVIVLPACDCRLWDGLAEPQQRVVWLTPGVNPTADLWCRSLGQSLRHAGYRRWQEHLITYGKVNALPILVLVAAVTQLGLIALALCLPSAR